LRHSCSLDCLLTCRDGEGRSETADPELPAKTGHVSTILSKESRKAWTKSRQRKLSCKVPPGFSTKYGKVNVGFSSINDGVGFF